MREVRAEPFPARDPSDYLSAPEVCLKLSDAKSGRKVFLRRLLRLR